MNKDIITDEVENFEKAMEKEFESGVLTGIITTLLIVLAFLGIISLLN